MNLSLTARWLARCYAEAEQVDRARASLDQALATKFADVAFDQGWIATHALAAEMVYRTGAARYVPWRQERLAPYAKRLVMQAWFVVCRGFVDRPLGLLAATIGSWNAAIEHLDDALRGHEELEATPLVCETQIDLALALLGRAEGGDVARAICSRSPTQRPPRSGCHSSHCGHGARPPEPSGAPHSRSFFASEASIPP